MKNIVGIAPAPGGNGYWLVGSDGGVFAFGGAAYEGSLPGLMASTPRTSWASLPAPNGNGYWLVGSDGGGLRLRGAPPTQGSLPADGVHVKTIVGVAPSNPGGNGYWLVGSDGGTFAFGSAPYEGSLPGLTASTSSNVVGIKAPNGNQATGWPAPTAGSSPSGAPRTRVSCPGPGIPHVGTSWARGGLVERCRLVPPRCL